MTEQEVDGLVTDVTEEEEHVADSINNMFPLDPDFLAIVDAYNESREV